MVTALLDLTVLSTPARARGIGRYALNLAHALGRRAAGRGVELRAVEQLSWFGQPVITRDLEHAARRVAGGERASHAAWAYRVRLRLAGATRASGADVLHSPHPDATPLGRIGCARVVTCHDLIGLAWPGHYTSWRDGWRVGRMRLDARRYGRADHVIAVSETTAHALVSLLRIPPNRITVVPNGVDLFCFRAGKEPGDEIVRQRFGVEERRYLLYVGGADWRKNVEGMFDALSTVRRARFAEDFKLVWAGALDRSDRDYVQRLAAQRTVTDAISRVGWIRDAELAALMRGAAALLFVSRAEGFGYPIVEAMACGCPVIASNRPITSEIAGDAALLVDPERPDTIANAALELVNDSSLRPTLVERGAVRCRAFDLTRMADETLAVYAHVARR